MMGRLGVPEEWVEDCGERNAVEGEGRGVNEVDKASSQCCAGVCTQSDESRRDLFFNLGTCFAPILPPAAAAIQLKH